MEKELNKIGFTFIFTAIALSISVFAFFSMNSGFGWFASNKNVTGNDSGIDIENSDSFVEGVEYYEINAIELDTAADNTAEDKNIYKFSATPSYSDTFKNYKADVLSGAVRDKVPSLRIFSLIEPERQVLLKLKLNSSITSVSVKGITDTVLFEAPSADSSNNNLSAILQYSIFSAAAEGISTETGENGELLVINGAVCDHQTFVTLDAVNTPAYTDAENTVPTDITFAEGDERAIYILLDYNEIMARYINDKYLNIFSDSDGDGMPDLSFKKNDFKFIVERK